MVGAIAGALVALTAALAQPPRPPATKEFQWDKLELWQPLLEYVILETRWKSSVESNFSSS